MDKVYAYTKEGKLTECSAPIDKRGVGRCNHIGHQEENESSASFIERMNKEIIGKLEEEMESRRVPNTKIINKNILSQLKRTEDSEYVREEEANLFEYALIVVEMQEEVKKVNRDRGSYSDRDFKEKIKEIDNKRVRKHNVAISAISVLNKLATLHELDPFYPGNPKEDHRQDVGTSILDFFKRDLESISNFSC